LPNEQIPVNAFTAAALQINIRNRNGIPMQRPADNLFRPEDHCMTTEILRAVRPDGPSRLPKPSEIFTKTSAEQEYDIEMATCLGNEESYLRAAKLYEIEFLAARKGDHKMLMQFLSEIGIRDYVFSAFGGSYARFTQFASIYSSPAGALWEKCLERAFFQFFQLGNEQVARVSPEVRCQLMAVGDGSASKLVSKIAQGANGLKDMMDAFAGEGGDGEAHEFEHQQFYEKFGKDVLELMNGQNGYANAGRQFLQPLQTETFKKYRRVGALFVLFMGRTLEAEENEETDSNTKWWHEIGRPTLEKCMADLEEQHMLQQQHVQQPNNANQFTEPLFEPILKPAMMVVMRLLLIALNLETDREKDYKDNLSPNLPLCKQFLLCRTIHINSRERDEEEDDDDDEEIAAPAGGGVQPSETGKFTIKSTSPSRAQAAGAALMCVFRFTIVNAMIHASETGDKEWKHVLWSPTVVSVPRHHASTKLYDMPSVHRKNRHHA
jgi:hypothetical protein